MRTNVLAARNSKPASQSCKKTFLPLNSSKYPHINQWSWAPIHTRMQLKPSHLSFILLHGSIRGNKQKNHTKYCAVTTCKRNKSSTIVKIREILLWEGSSTVKSRLVAVDCRVMLTNLRSNHLCASVSNILMGKAGILIPEKCIFWWTNLVECHKRHRLHKEAKW